MHRILIVEDEESTRNLIFSILVKSEYKVKTAKNGNEAIIALRKNSFDIILLDLMMPEMDGLRLLELIRSNTKTKNIAVILCSAVKDHNKIKTATTLGISDYILKPFTKQSLLEKIQKVADKIPIKLEESAHEQEKPVIRVVEMKVNEPGKKLRPSSKPEMSGWEELDKFTEQDEAEASHAETALPDMEPCAAKVKNTAEEVSQAPDASGWDALEKMFSENNATTEHPNDAQQSSEDIANAEGAAPQTEEKKSTPDPEISGSEELERVSAQASKGVTEIDTPDDTETENFLPTLVDELQKELLNAGKKLETGEFDDFERLIQNLVSYSENNDESDLQTYAAEFTELIEAANDQRRSSLLAMKRKLHLFSQYIEKK